MRTAGWCLVLGFWSVALRCVRVPIMSDSAVKVKENELLPLVLEELPHLHISPHTLGRMWEQQIQQVDRLHAVGSPHGRRRSDLSSQVRVWLLKDEQTLSAPHAYM